MSSVNYTEEQEIYIYEIFFQTRSHGKTRKKFTKKYPACPAPEKSIIDDIMKKLGESGSAVSNKITKKKKQPMEEYRISKVDDLKRGDTDARVNFCEWFSKSVNEGTLDSQFIFYTSEAWFNLSGYVYTHNTQCWLSQKPQIPLGLSQSRNDKKVGVWCSVSANRIIGPIFYEETLSPDKYKTLILDNFLDGLTEEEKSKGWFQVDTEAFRMDEACADRLGKVFDERVIGTGLWPARSPDLTPCHFYLWEMLINKVFEIKPQKMEDLRKVIQEEIDKSDLSVLQQIHKNAISRYELCISQGGETFEYLL